MGVDEGCRLDHCRIAVKVDARVFIGEPGMNYSGLREYLFSPPMSPAPFLPKLYLNVPTAKRGCLAFKLQPARIGSAPFPTHQPLGCIGQWQQHERSSLPR